jgi:hypothetical protein
MSGFGPDWLRLRAPFDRAARSGALAEAFAAALRGAGGRPLRLIDLGAGIGGNARALAPLIAVDHAWELIDNDAILLAWQRREHLAWAKRRGYAVRKDGTAALLIDAPGGCWRFAGRHLDLATDLEDAFADPCDGVAMAAFADLVGASWIDRLVAALRRGHVPLISALEVDGRREWQPAAPEDPIMREAFAAHQRRDKGVGAALGAEAPQYLAAALRAQGFAVTTAASNWQIGTGDPAMLRALISGEAEAASEAAPEAAGAIARWRARREAEISAGALTVTIGHCDLLAVPR